MTKLSWIFTRERKERKAREKEKGCAGKRTAPPHKVRQVGRSVEGSSHLKEEEEGADIRFFGELGGGMSDKI